MPQPSCRETSQLLPVSLPAHPFPNTHSRTDPGKEVASASKTSCFWSAGVWVLEGEVDEEGEGKRQGKRERKDEEEKAGVRGWKQKLPLISFTPNNNPEV